MTPSGMSGSSCRGRTERVPNGVPILGRLITFARAELSPRAGAPPLVHRRSPLLPEGRPPRSAGLRSRSPGLRPVTWLALTIARLAAVAWLAFTARRLTRTWTPEPHHDSVDRLRPACPYTVAKNRSAGPSGARSPDDDRCRGTLRSDGSAHVTILSSIWRLDTRFALLDDRMSRSSRYALRAARRTEVETTSEPLTQKSHPRTKRLRGWPI